MIVKYLKKYQKSRFDKKNSLIDLRRLLVPTGLPLLLELVHISHYFHLIFGFIDQWWSSSSDDDHDNNRVLNNIQQWTTLLEQIQRFNIIESALNQNENTLIISQKTISNDILQRLDERKNQSWLIFTKDDQNNKDISYSKFDIKYYLFELICGTLSLILQTIQKSSPHFYPFVYVLTDHAQFNNDSYLNLIASPFIGLARSLITEYERHRLKLIDLQYH
ncbi:unnamed protein product [Adineta steineri]|uniref:Uncharacterized protein n=1 Tax=Adineta steineri TaxID=433720 RepID=A0A813WXS9_9BILA|nr:unnamed protein product [Adineta steineri]CAF1419918.1 unnamed protein product [Adineta steineri]CAF1420339.1 unnamed protein product [Adineta steineri]